MQEINIEVKEKQFLFGQAANYDFVQDALIIEKLEKGIDKFTEEEVDPLQWAKDKLSLFVKNEESGKIEWTYKGSRDLLEVAIYSGINNYLRENKKPLISLNDAKNMLYEFSFEERGQITTNFIVSLVDKVSQNGQGELKAQQEAAS